MGRHNASPFVFSHGIVLRPYVVIAVHFHRTILIQHGHQVLCHHKTLTHTPHRVARRTQHVCIGVNVTFGIFVGLFSPTCFTRDGIAIANMSPSDVTKLYLHGDILQNDLPHNIHIIKT